MKEGSALLVQWDKRVTKDVMVMMGFPEDLVVRENLDWVVKMEPEV